MKNKLTYIDTHMHSTESYLEVENTGILIDRAKAADVDKIILLSTNLKDLVLTKKIASKYSFVFPGIGIHPLDIKTGNEADEIHKNISPEIVAIGEVGLDYHYQNSPAKDLQKKVLREQLILAKDYNLAVSLHARDALDDAFALINVDRFRNLRIIMHAFSGNVEQAKKFLKLPNIYFGISGVITFKNAQLNRDVLEILPLDRIVTETDTPYLTPHPHRGKWNEPAMVIHVTKKIAELKKIPEIEVCQQVLINAKKIFNF